MLDKNNRHGRSFETSVRENCPITGHGSDAWLVQRDGWREPASALSSLSPSRIQEHLVIARRCDLISTKMSLLPAVKGNICDRRAPCLCLTLYSAKQYRVAAALTEHAVDWICSAYTNPTNPVLSWDESSVRREERFGARNKDDRARLIILASG